MRVTAIQSMKNGIMKTYGEGEYIGNLVPDSKPFNKFNVKNPCIKLDSGDYVWGFECWWGETTRMNKQYAEHIKETIIVKSDNIQPKNK